MRNRVVRVDFAGLLEEVLSLPAGTPEEMRRAKAANDLIAAVAGERDAPDLSASYLLSVEERAFDDARRMLDGQAEEAALRAALESIDPGAWDSLLSRVKSLAPSPDPSVAPEFV